MGACLWDLPTHGQAGKRLDLEIGCNLQLPRRHHRFACARSARPPSFLIGALAPEWVARRAFVMHMEVIGKKALDDVCHGQCRRRLARSSPNLSASNSSSSPVPRKRKVG